MPYAAVTHRDDTLSCPSGTGMVTCAIDSVKETRSLLAACKNPPVETVSEAGAVEVHLRISSPPIVSPCFYGIDMADEDELAAAHRSVEEMREHIGATSLHYLSLDGMQAATRMPEGSVCRACFTRSYPTAVPKDGRTKLRFEMAPVLGP